MGYVVNERDFHHESIKGYELDKQQISDKVVKYFTSTEFIDTLISIQHNLHRYYKCEYEYNNKSEQIEHFKLDRTLRFEEINKEFIIAISEFNGIISILFQPYRIDEIRGNVKVKSTDWSLIGFKSEEHPNLFKLLNHNQEVNIELVKEDVNKLLDVDFINIFTYTVESIFISDIEKRNALFSSFNERVVLKIKIDTEDLKLQEQFNVDSINYDVKNKLIELRMSCINKVFNQSVFNKMRDKFDFDYGGLTYFSKDRKESFKIYFECLDRFNIYVNSSGKTGESSMQIHIRNLYWNLEFENNYLKITL